MTAPSALTSRETDVLRAVGEILAAVRAADPSREAYPGEAALTAIAGAAEAQADPSVGQDAMFVFIGLTGADFGAATLDALHETLRSDPVDSSVLGALRPGQAGVGDAAQAQPEPAPRSAPVPAPPDAVPLADAARVLTEVLDERGLTGETPDPRGAWQVFVEFAKRPVAATPPLYVDPDMCLFEGFCRADGGRSRVAWDFVRQFSVNTAGGDYDHMEQLHLTVSFTAKADVANSVSSPLGGVWSGADIDDWAAQVEALDVFAIHADRTAPVTIRIQHENV